MSSLSDVLIKGALTEAFLFIFWSGSSFMTMLSSRFAMISLFYQNESTSITSEQSVYFLLTPILLIPTIKVRLKNNPNK